MRAALGDDALVEHQDLVGVDHGREAVRDHDRRASARDALQGRLNLAFGKTVERRRRFVEDQNRRRLQHRARDGDPLLLAARKLEAPLADRRLIAKRQRADEPIDLRVLGRRDDVPLAGAVSPVADVVEERIVEQHRVLRHHADRARGGNSG